MHYTSDMHTQIKPAKKEQQKIINDTFKTTSLLNKEVVGFMLQMCENKRVARINTNTAMPPIDTLANVPRFPLVNTSPMAQARIKTDSKISSPLGAKNKKSIFLL